MPHSQAFGRRWNVSHKQGLIEVEDKPLSQATHGAWVKSLTIAEAHMPHSQAFGRRWNVSHKQGLIEVEDKPLSQATHGAWVFCVLATNLPSAI